MNDLELLRQFEPVLRFTRGEMFFPCAVDEYVRRCSLWDWPNNRPSELLVPVGELDLDQLAQYGDVEVGITRYLRFVQEPLRGLDYQRWALYERRSEFQTPGRLARVGLGPRLLDALFSLSLLLRGSVPGGTTAAAERTYREIVAEDPRNVYYARVTRDGGYIVLHYLFFYVMNDWRSTFYGANDHEADWEQVFVYLEEHSDRPPTPCWVAYASHDFAGDDLRRRWDDPELVKEGCHPVVFVGAGSHASYFEKGEYLTSVELRFVRPLLDVVHMIQRVWRNTLQQGDPDRLVERIEAFLSVPFVDYARGDGEVIGPGGDKDWSPVLLTEDMAWAEQYRGLWGLDARDPFAGESAPGGPKFNSDGTVRRSWYDPLGWSGLSKVAPPHAAAQILAQRVARLQEQLVLVEERIAVLGEALPRIDLEVKALQGVQHLRALWEARQQELLNRESELKDLRQERNDLTEAIGAGHRYLDQVRHGFPGDPQAHLRHRHRPQTEAEVNQGMLAEAWAAVSVGLLLIGVVVMVIFELGAWWTAPTVLIGAFIFVEALLHRRLLKLLLDLTILLAILTAGVLMYEFYWEVMLVGMVALASLIIIDNIRELRGR